MPKLDSKKSARRWHEDLTWCTRRLRFEVCWHRDDYNVPQHIRPIQGHCAPHVVNSIGLRLIEIPVNWTRDTYHVERQKSLKRNVVRNGLMGLGQSVQNGRQATYISAAHPLLDNSNPTDRAPFITESRDKSKTKFVCDSLRQHPSRMFAKSRSCSRPLVKVRPPKEFLATRNITSTCAPLQRRGQPFARDHFAQRSWSNLPQKDIIPKCVHCNNRGPRD